MWKLYHENCTFILSISKVDREHGTEDMCPYGSASEIIAVMLSPKSSDLSAMDSIRRCHELEAELQTEREMVKKLRTQLTLSQQMLSHLRSAHSKCPIVVSINQWANFISSLLF